jgi:hypothetical protein
MRNELPTCQAFLLLQTPDAILATRVILIVKVVKALFDQKELQGIFRFICPPATEAMIPLEWNDLTVFDGTHDYQRACAKLVASLAAQSKDTSGIAETLLVQGTNDPLAQTEVVNK